MRPSGRSTVKLPSCDWPISTEGLPRPAEGRPIRVRTRTGSCTGYRILLRNLPPVPVHPRAPTRIAGSPGHWPRWMTQSLSVPLDPLPTVTELPPPGETEVVPLTPPGPVVTEVEFCA